MRIQDRLLGCNPARLLPITDKRDRLRRPGRETPRFMVITRRSNNPRGCLRVPCVENSRQFVVSLNKSVSLVDDERRLLPLNKPK